MNIYHDIRCYSNWHSHEMTDMNIKTILALCGVAILTVSANGNELTGCVAKQFVEYKTRGLIHCNFPPEFISVYWYDVDNSEAKPVLMYDRTTKTGEGFIRGEYDIQSNGTLIIRNVSMSHEKVFKVICFRPRELFNTYHIEVIVTVTPEQGIPRINNCSTAVELVSYGLDYDMVVAKRLQGRYEVKTDKTLYIDSAQIEDEGKFICISSDGVNHYVAAVNLVVLVSPSPSYLMTEGCTTGNCMILSNVTDSLTCSVTGVRPPLNLKWSAEEEKSFIITHQIQTSVENMGLYDIKSIMYFETSKIICEDTVKVTCEAIGAATQLFRPLTEVRINVVRNCTEESSELEVKSANKRKDNYQSYLLALLAINFVFIVTFIVVIKNRKNFMKQIQTSYSETILNTTSGCYVPNRLNVLPFQKLRGKSTTSHIILLSFEEIFTDPEIKDKHILIEGRSGIGKTALVLHIIENWLLREDDSPLKEYGMIIMLPLKNVKNFQNDGHKVSIHYNSTMLRFLVDVMSKDKDGEDILCKGSSNTLCVSHIAKKAKSGSWIYDENDKKMSRDIARFKEKGVLVDVNSKKKDEERELQFSHDVYKYLCIAHYFINHCAVDQRKQFLQDIDIPSNPQLFIFTCGLCKDMETFSMIINHLLVNQRKEWYPYHITDCIVECFNGSPQEYHVKDLLQKVCEIEYTFNFKKMESTDLRNAKIYLFNTCKSLKLPIKTLSLYSRTTKITKTQITIKGCQTPLNVPEKLKTFVMDDLNQNIKDTDVLNLVEQIDNISEIIIRSSRIPRNTTSSVFDILRKRERRSIFVIWITFEGEELQMISYPSEVFNCWLNSTEIMAVVSAV
ncbi:hypothetical protein BSL78_03160 [Apostichopus japonicus]|uniref:Ig-like domain-containing protein n=1 Tax=Stichopus japonicus TaxID=307972 RepID=A0A2G8LIC9_STIJA|nr:hypothetical protein BSL78_03160 [Apostichopus japonicus]